MLQRLLRFIRRLFGGDSPTDGSRDHAGLLAVETESLRKQIASYNVGLATHAGLCERLISQIRRQEAEATALEAQVTAHLQSGSREKAALHALDLQTLRSELVENRAQAAAAEATYRELLRTRDVAVREAQMRLKAVQDAIQGLDAQRAAADMTELASGMVGQNVAGDDTLGRLHEIVEAEKARETGRAGAARMVLEGADVMRLESHRKALAEAALAEFTARAELRTGELDALPGSDSAREQGPPERRPQLPE